MEALFAAQDLDAEILLILREEVFSKADCAYFGLLISRRVMLASKQDIQRQSRPDGSSAWNKSASVETTTKNAIDVLRMISCLDSEESLSAASCLVDDASNHGPADSSDIESDESDDDDRVDEEDAHKKKKRALGTSNEVSGAKRRAVVSDRKKELEKSSEVSPGNRKKSRAQELLDPSFHRRAFSRAWLTLMSLPMNSSQHKLVLRHLSDHVLEHIDRPLLLADYLTNSYNSGGIIAVLALESLFQVIVKNNLDYPKFFLSLYRLCTVEVFSAKYRSKFMKLLNASLKSTNLTQYTVAAFIKRLTRLTLFIPSPSALFCIAQVTWLLRRHPQCMALIHRPSGSSAIEGEYDSDCDDEETFREILRFISSNYLTCIKAIIWHVLPNVRRDALLTRQAR